MEKQQTYYPLYWVALSALVVAADYMTGPAIQFPVALVVPVVLASWFSGRAWGIVLAVLLSSARFLFIPAWREPLSALAIGVNFSIRLVVFIGIALLVSHNAALTRDIKVLKGIIPICSNCKKIRDEDDAWKPLETYISEHTEADFSHGLCSECAEKLYPQYHKKQQR